MAKTKEDNRWPLFCRQCGLGHAFGTKGDCVCPNRTDNGFIDDKKAPHIKQIISFTLAQHDRELREAVERVIKENPMLSIDGMTGYRNCADKILALLTPNEE